MADRLGPADSNGQQTEENAAGDEDGGGETGAGGAGAAGVTGDENYENNILRGLQGVAGGLDLGALLAAASGGGGGAAAAAGPGGGGVAAAAVAGGLDLGALLAAASGGGGGGGGAAAAAAGEPDRRGDLDPEAAQAARLLGIEDPAIFRALLGQGRRVLGAAGADGLGNRELAQRFLGGGAPGPRSPASHAELCARLERHSGRDYYEGSSRSQAVAAAFRAVDRRADDSRGPGAGGPFAKTTPGTLSRPSITH